MSQDKKSIALNIAVLTISDSRTETDDLSGKVLTDRVEKAGHYVFEKIIVADDIYQIRAVISNWVAANEVDAVITTGGTGVTGRDGTPEAVTPLLDKVLDGFGELFRMLSYQDIKTSTMQSRAIAGVANGTYIFCLPGSSGACKTAWDEVINAQLDSCTKPCNLVQLMPRLKEK